jgi:hypothetical protein
MCLPSRAVFWLKWTDAFGRTHYRSSASHDRDVAENMLRDELKRKGDGLSASPDPRRTLVNDLLEALKNRYRVEGRRSLERLLNAAEHLLRMFRGVPAAQVKGADVLRYANLRLEEQAKPATINRELAALRAAYRLGLDNDTIVAMPRIRLLPENNARQGFADARRSRRSVAGSRATSPTPCSSCSSPAGGAARRCCRSRGRRSISRAALCGSSRARRRTTTAEPSP